jgi:murein DD-endopeptidase MepM/ murein hydrolase activator NlpD
VKLLRCALLVICLIIPPPSLSSLQAAEPLDPSGSTGTPGQTDSGAALSSSCAGFNALNSLIRDGKIDRRSARSQLSRLLAEVRQGYFQAGGAVQPGAEWVFPLAGYDVRAIEGGRSHGYIARGYDFFDGNRHGGHPAFDIFIHDRNRESLDDRSGRPVQVLSVTGGIVVAMEREWQQGSSLRGGKYIWVYDPAEELLVYYAHNGELMVDLGAIVRPGDVLATVGRSGFNAAKRRSPTHLHLSVLRVRDGRHVPVDVYRQLAHAKTSTAR